MTNLEKYAEEIKNYRGNDFCRDFIRPIILKKEFCSVISCEQCIMMRTMWLMEEYTEPEEPETDWSKVKVDTPILVRNIENEEWNKRYFARYENETIYAWVNGRTSWASIDYDDVYPWKYVKLAEQEESDE